MIGLLEAPTGFLEKFGINTGSILAVIGLALAYFAFSIFNFESYRVFSYIAVTAPLWLPFLMFFLFFDAWMHYIHKDYDMKQGRVTLEIKLPQDVFKSPEAMELALIQLHQTASPDNHIQAYVDGKKPPTFGLEIVSRGGDVRFYISVPQKKFKNIVETQLYAQYPGIEIVELDIDYTAEITWDPKKFAYFSLHFGTRKADAYPIKTYVDYNLHTMPKEEEKSDPITPMLEMMGNIGPGEHFWVQILISAHREMKFKDGSLTFRHDWKDEARAEIRKIITDANLRVGIDGTKEGQSLNMMNLSESEKDTIKAIERSLGKNPFDTAIRAMYIAKTEAFLPGERIGALITGWRSYDDLNRNTIGVRWRTDFDWNWWQDPKGRRKMAMKRRELNEYKSRDYYPYTKADTTNVFTTEELATIYHFPGKVATTPSLGRIPSKRAEPPSNLPTS
jgi:hypothetical protein